MQGNMIIIKICTKPLDFWVEKYYFCTPFCRDGFAFFIAQIYITQIFAYKNEVILNNGKYTLFFN